MSAHVANNKVIFDDLYLKILTPKELIQRLPIALVQVEPGNTSENLLSDIC